jgi:hypothetical protein
VVLRKKSRRDRLARTRDGHRREWVSGRVEHDLDVPRDTLDNLHDQRLVETVELGDGERGLTLTTDGRDLLRSHSLVQEAEPSQVFYAGVSGSPRWPPSSCRSRKYVSRDVLTLGSSGVPELFSDRRFVERRSLFETANDERSNDGAFYADFDSNSATIGQSTINLDHINTLVVDDVDLTGASRTHDGLICSCRSLAIGT